jgi:hypothetical protein
MMSRKVRAPVKDFRFIICLVRPTMRCFRPDTVAVARHKTPDNRVFGQQKGQACSRLSSGRDLTWMAIRRSPSWRHTADAATNGCLRMRAPVSSTRRTPDTRSPAAGRQHAAPVLLRVPQIVEVRHPERAQVIRAAPLRGRRARRGEERAFTVSTPAWSSLSAYSR